MNITFNELLDSVEEMNISERELFVDIVQKRIHEQRRKEIIKDVVQGRKDYKAGKVKRGNSKDLMKALLNE